MATRVCVLDGGDPKDSENTLNSFLIKRDGNAFWQIGAEMSLESQQMAGMAKIGKRLSQQMSRSCKMFI